MSSTRTILAAHKIRAKKYMGQNFLKSDSICNAIVDQLSITKNDIILEIGPGLGALTIPVAKLAKKVFAIEKDYKLAEILYTYLLASETTNVELITDDVLKTNFDDIYKDVKHKLILIGNLPYNISSQVLIKTIKNRNMFHKAVFMLQKEVADRICSEPGSKNYGRLSVFLQYYAEIRTILKVKPLMFFPKPKIESSVVELVFFNKPSFIAKDEALLSSVIKSAFAKRRKTLKNSLSESLLGVDAKTSTIILNKAEINPTRRAETLSVEEFVLLSNCFYDAKINHNNRS